MSDIESFATGLTQGINSYLGKRVESQLEEQKQANLERRQEGVLSYKDKLESAGAPGKLAGQEELAKFKSTLTNPNHPQVSPELASAIQTGDQDKVNDQWQKENPGQSLPTQIITLTQGAKKNVTGGAMAEARASMADTALKRLIGMFEGPEALQSGMRDASGRINNIDRFYGVYKTMQDQGFEASKLQRNLLNTEVARVITGSGGVMTDEGFNRVASETAKQKVADWRQWLMNEASAADFKSFADQSKSLMDNEYTINQQIFQGGQKSSANILKLPQPTPYQPPATIPGVQTPPAVNPNQPAGMPAGDMIHVYPSGKKARFNPQTRIWEQYNG